MKYPEIERIERIVHISAFCLYKGSVCLVRCKLNMVYLSLYIHARLSQVKHSKYFFNCLIKYLINIVFVVDGSHRPTVDAIGIFGASYSRRRHNPLFLDSGVYHCNKEFHKQSDKV